MASGTDGNVCTKDQVMAIKEKGWTPMYRTENGWMYYWGIDDADAVALPTTDETADDNAPIYNLSGQRVTQPIKSGIYIVNGKKVLIKK